MQTNDLITAGIIGGGALLLLSAKPAAVKQPANNGGYGQGYGANYTYRMLHLYGKPTPANSIAPLPYSYAPSSSVANYLNKLRTINFLSPAVKQIQQGQTLAEQMYALKAANPRANIDKLWKSSQGPGAPSGKFKTGDKYSYDYNYQLPYVEVTPENPYALPYVEVTPQNPYTLPYVQVTPQNPYTLPYVQVTPQNPYTLPYVQVTPPVQYSPPPLPYVYVTPPVPYQPPYVPPPYISPPYTPPPYVPQYQSPPSVFDYWYAQSSGSFDSGGDSGGWGGGGGYDTGGNCFYY